MFLHLKNVRAIEDSQPVELRSLTLVVGRNSAGKSSFVRWLPLLAQSRSAGLSTPVVWRSRGGMGVDYGSFEETVTRGHAEEGIAYRFGGFTQGGVACEASAVLMLRSGSTLLTKCGTRYGGVDYELVRGDGGDACTVSATYQKMTERTTTLLWKDRGLIPRLEPSADAGDPFGKAAMEILDGWKKRKMDRSRLIALAAGLSGWTPAEVRAYLVTHDAGTATWRENLPAPTHPSYT